MCIPLPVTSPLRRRHTNLLAAVTLRTTQSVWVIAHCAAEGLVVQTLEEVIQQRTANNCGWLNAETASVARQRCPADLPGDASKRQELGFGHRTFCLGNKQQFQPIRYREFSLS